MTSFATAAAQRPSPKSAGTLSLPQSWTFWYLIRHTRGSVQAANYENNLHQIATATTAEDFWAIYGHLKRARDLPVNSDYQVFRTGVKPVWEDAANANGGKWILRLRKGIAARLWEHLLLALLAGLLDDCGVCGVVLSVRYAEDIIAVWNQSASDEPLKNRLRDQIKTLLSLPSNTPMDFKAHDTALKEGGSGHQRPNDKKQ